MEATLGVRAGFVKGCEIMFGRRTMTVAALFVLTAQAAAAAERSDDVQNADDTLARIEARIQEYLKSRPAGQAVPALERVRQQELSKR